MTTTGLLGGSFNPLHNGHLAIARQTREALGLDQILFMLHPCRPFITEEIWTRMGEYGHKRERMLIVVDIAGLMLSADMALVENPLH